MRYCLASDLHVDSYRKKPNPGILSVDWAEQHNHGSEVLVLAGDIANQFKTTFKLAERALPYYEHIVIVDGNHEHYGSLPARRSPLLHGKPITRTMRYMREKADRRPRITYLDGTTSYRRGDVVFVGVNGWYDWQIMCSEFTREQQHNEWLGLDPITGQSAWNRGSNDQYLNGNPELLAFQQARQLKAMVEQFSLDSTVKQIVVVTHTAPRRELLHNNPFDPTWQRLSGSYANSKMSEVYRLPGHKIVHWCYGHTHDRRDITIDGVRYINNARGYASEQWRQREWKLEQFDTDVV